MQPVAASDALRFLPGAVVNAGPARRHCVAVRARRRLALQQSDCRRRTVNEPGGTFDFGVVPLDETERLEFVRGAQSTLYGSDAMTSVVQIWTRTGQHSDVPELTFRRRRREL